MINKNKAILAFSLSIFSIAAGAGTVGGLNEFTGGTPALASEVNANFDTVETAVNDNDTRVSQLEMDAANVQLLLGLTSTASVDGRTYFHFQKYISADSGQASAEGYTTAPSRGAGRIPWLRSCRPAL